jgi:hypothetical protein
MTYNSNLKDWGDTGVEYPDGYNYSDERPVDAYDDYLTHTLISDVKRVFNILNNFDVNKADDSHNNSSHDKNYLTASDVHDLDHLIPVRTDDPSNPTEGQVWIRSDL